jgi:hypothetical protein
MKKTRAAELRSWARCLVSRGSCYCGYMYVWWSYRMRRKEDNIMAEDASPYDRCELCSSCVSGASGYITMQSVYIRSRRRLALRLQCLYP